MVSACVKNSLRFSYVLWAGTPTLKNIKQVLGLHKHLTGAVKSNVEVALSLADNESR